MASRMEHVMFLSTSLALILILLVTVTVLAAPSGLLESSSSTSASSSTSSKAAPVQKRSANGVAQKPRNEGLPIPRRFDRHSQSADQSKDQDQDLRKVDVMAAGGADSRLKTWPLLVGLDVEEAKQKLLEEHPTLLVQIVPEGNMVTTDFNLRRVRIFKNEQQKVSKAPRVG